jgi:tripartite-type tricarboxylate transporter receptor subunit TctC
MRLLAMDGEGVLDENVPLLTDLGYDGIGFDTFGFVAGPVGMDQKVIDAIDAWAQDFCADEEQRDKMAGVGFTTDVWSREDALAKQKKITEDTKVVTEALGW